MPSRFPLRTQGILESRVTSAIIYIKKKPCIRELGKHVTGRVTAWLGHMLKVANNQSVEEADHEIIPLTACALPSSFQPRHLLKQLILNIHFIIVSIMV